MSKEIETRVLSALIRDRYMLTRAMGDGLSPDTFAENDYRLIFKTVLDMTRVPDQVVDWITIENTLRRAGLLTPEAGQALAVLKAEERPEADQVMAYIEILKDQKMKNSLLKLSQVIGDYATGTGQHKDEDFLGFSSRIVQTLVDLQKQKARRRLNPIKDTISAIQEWTNRQTNGDRKLLGFCISPHERLQQVLSGIRKGFYYGLAGPPRRGKTTLALDLASRLAENNRFPVLFYTWEQTRRTLAARLLGRECFINPVRLLTEVHPGQKQRHALVSKVIERSIAYSKDLYIIEAGRKDTIERIKAQAYNIMHEYRTDNIALFFDYLQKIPLDKQYEDIRGRVNEASAQLADLSLELECPVFAISALDKEGCKLDEKPPSYDEYATTLYSRPTMHNCVGGGDLEYDLDVAMVLSKDWIATKNLLDRLTVEDRESQTADPPQIDIVNLHVDKNRDSAGEQSLTVQYAFFININKFVEVGFKMEEEYTKDFKGFAKAEDVFGTLLDTGMFRI